MRSQRKPYKWVPEVMLLAQQAYETIYERGIPDSIRFSHSFTQERDSLYRIGNPLAFKYSLGAATLNIIDEQTKASYSIRLPESMEIKEADALFLFFRLFVIEHVKAVFPQLTRTLPYEQLEKSIPEKDKAFLEFFLPYSIPAYWKRTKVYKQYVLPSKKPFVSTLSPRHNL